MPEYRYKARDAQGRLQEGKAMAAAPERLAADLRGRNLLVTEITAIEDANTTPPAPPLLRGWLPMTGFDVEMGLHELCTMLRNGLTLLASLRTVAEQARRPRAARIWRNVAEQIERGSTFSDALRAHAGRFPDYVVQLIRVGEHSGELEIVLVRAVEYLERSRNLRMTVINALTYPAIVLVMAVGVALFMVLSVIPKIQQFLAGQQRQLPPLTQTLLDVSDFLRLYLPYIGLALVVWVVALVALNQWPPGRRGMHALALRIPILGIIQRLSGTAVFARSMSILLESGVPLLAALQIVERLLGNQVMADRIGSARQAVMQGAPLSQSFTNRREFRPMLRQMIVVGEASGVLGRVLADVALFHENQLLALIRRFSVLIEPVMIIVVGGIVGFVYIAFFVALFSLAGNLS